ncbi:hypothetical protein [Ruegeria hyattellae]|uniref:hypothetical protein n=1 Tax=Ruegeria hyattellae TaxID=3233337 RepID=UPI00355C2FCB
MARNPDALSKYPKIQEWAAKFYEVKAWQMSNTPPDPAESDPLAGRRVTARSEIDKIALGKTLLSGSRRAFASAKAALARKVATISDAATFDEVDGEIAKLAVDVAAQTEIASARIISEQSMQQVQAKFDSVRKSLDEGGYVYLQAKLSDVMALHREAESKSDYDTAQDGAAAFIMKAAQAEAFGDFYSKWRQDTLAFTEMAVPDVQKATALGNRSTCKAAANAETRQGKFTEAQAELVKFAKQAPIVEADFQDARPYFAKVKEFENEHRVTFSVVASSDVKDANKLKRGYKAARKLGDVDHKYVEAIAAIDVLLLFVTANYDLAVEINKYDKMMLRNEPYRNAKRDAEARIKAGDPAGAAQLLRDFAEDAGNTAAIDACNIRVSERALSREYDALSAILTGTEKSALDDAWTDLGAARSQNPPDYATAKPHYDKIVDMTNLSEIISLMAEIRPVRGKYPAADGYGFLNSYQTSRSAGRFAEALQHLKPVVPKVKALAGYLDVLAFANQVLSKLPGGSALAAGLTTEITQAEVKARGGNPDGAQTDLDAVLTGTDYAELAEQQRDYEIRYDALKKRQNRALRLMIINEAKTPLVTALTSIRSLGSSGAYDEALLQMHAHGHRIEEALAYAAAHKQAKMVIDALKRAVAQDPTREAVIFAGGPSKSDLESDYGKAEAKAKSGDYDQARADFDALILVSKTMIDACAQAYEDADAVGSNAGHSLKRHGDHVSDDALILRLKDGSAPGGGHSPTSASSKFKSRADWLAGREAAAEMAMQAGIDINETELDPGNQPTPHDYEIDHGKPIDEAFVGVSKQAKFDPNTGEFGTTEYYDTYEKMSDLTRSYVLFVWEYEKIDGATPEDNADYISKYTAKNGAAPAKIAGRWVMMQQYPVAEGWDDELKAYVK